MSVTHFTCLGFGEMKADFHTVIQGKGRPGPSRLVNTPDEASHDTMSLHFNGKTDRFSVTDNRKGKIIVITQKFNLRLALNLEGDGNFIRL